MIYTIPTKNGFGIELWGTHDDLSNLHSIMAKFWGNEDFLNKKGFSNRDSLISGFSYEIRKAYEQSRLIRANSHHSAKSIEHFGIQLSWVHILFSLTALRFNMRFMESDKDDLSMFVQLEHSLEQSMNDFDKVGAKLLIPFIDGGIYAGNEYLYQYMRAINVDYFELGGEKKSFRILPELLNKAVLNTPEYMDYLSFLTKEAKRLKCDISDLELDDEHIPYESIIW